jgi:receptor protein-tyrosine kinase
LPAGFDLEAKSEQMRSLRTELMLRHDRRVCAANVIAVVSPAAGEGRSEMAAGLAQTFARTGQPTLLIDADLRRPTQHVRFGQDHGPGLIEAITSGCAPQLRPLDHAGRLFLLPAGGPSDAAAELLSSRALEVLLDSLAQQFDHIILDTPPIGAFPDALALGTVAKRVLVVNRAHHTSLNGTREMLRRLEATRAEVLGAVVCHF